MFDRDSKRRSRWKQLCWLVVLWASGVATVALVAGLLRLSMTAIGLKSP